MTASPKNNNNNDLDVAHPQSGSSSTLFLIEVEFGNVGFWGEGKTGVPGEKPLGTKERTNNKLNPHMASTPGFEPGPHWWEASALTTGNSITLGMYRVFQKFVPIVNCILRKAFNSSLGKCKVIQERNLSK